MPTGSSIYPTIQGPAVYRMRVRGRLNPTLADRLENVHIANLLRDDGDAESVLQGRLEDRAAFSGDLNTLY